MKSNLKLKDKTVVGDLHGLKRFLKQTSDFQKANEQAYNWLKVTHKDDLLADKLLDSKNHETSILHINKQLENNLTRKLRVLENMVNETKPRVKLNNLQPVRVIQSKSRDELIKSMQEVHKIES